MPNFELSNAQISHGLRIIFPAHLCRCSSWVTALCVWRMWSRVCLPHICVKFLLKSQPTLLNIVTRMHAHTLHVGMCPNGEDLCLLRTCLEFCSWPLKWSVCCGLHCCCCCRKEKRESHVYGVMTAFGVASIFTIYAVSFRFGGYLIAQHGVKYLDVFR